MKTKIWIILLCALFLLCLGLSLPIFLPGKPAARVRILSDGVEISSFSLSKDQEFTVTSRSGGSNTITVRDGAIAVTEASCPDHYCMHRGFCTGGSSIVCLPNRLVIEFLGNQDVDFVVG